ncbi:MAG TPA: hypothetical protein VM368_02300 [Flavisolibacter sp.]|nr:hypothetical protein [Flavisolibacter sp.]
MRIRTLTIIGVILSIICILIIANSIEQEDTNAASMYLVVFPVPSCIVVVLNGLFLSLLKKRKSRLVKITGSMFPVVVLSLLSLKESLTFGGIDGNLVFVVQVGAIAVEVTNLLWIINVLKAKTCCF